MAKTGVTTGNLKMRSGPGMQFEPPLAFLEPNTPLEILDETGDWLHVKAGGKEGYVGRKYVNITAEAAPPPAAESQKPQSMAAKPPAQPKDDLDAGLRMKR
jgi:uncharacterized protein YraI